MPFGCGQWRLWLCLLWPVVIIIFVFLLLLLLSVFLSLQLFVVVGTAVVDDDDNSYLQTFANKKFSSFVQPTTTTTEVNRRSNCTFVCKLQDSSCWRLVSAVMAADEKVVSFSVVFEWLRRRRRRRWRRMKSQSTTQRTQMTKANNTTIKKVVMVRANIQSSKQQMAAAAVAAAATQLSKIIVRSTKGWIWGSERRVDGK